MAELADAHDSRSCAARHEGSTPSPSIMSLNLNDLILDLIAGGHLQTLLIIEAFKKIDRKDFVPRKIEDDVYLDSALPIGFGQTISQPLVVAFMLELLNPEPGEKILDIGSGSGWKAALLAYCASKTPIKSADKRGKVVTIERIPELKEMAEKNIAKYNFIKKGIVKVLLGDGSNPAPDLMPGGYDKIIAGAAGDKIPEAWREQLKVGGRIVAPVRNDIVVADKISDLEFREKNYRGFSFVPLIRGE